jgi:geranylgeranyldiphosphate transferase
MWTQETLGQDISLVWRRDGFPDFPDQKQALETYRHSAYLKTGALFRLVGQLVFGNHEKDELMSQIGCGSLILSYIISIANGSP